MTWVPKTGRLILGAWPDGGGDPQVLAEGPISDWDVQWDDSGTELAVWVARDGADGAGKLSLYSIDPDTGRADLDHPHLDAVPAIGGFALQPGRLAWSAPDQGGDTSVEVLAWSGDTFGRVSLPDRERVDDRPLTPARRSRCRSARDSGPAPRWGTVRRPCDEERSSRPRQSSPRSRWPGFRFQRARGHPRPPGRWTWRPIPLCPSLRTLRLSAPPTCPVTARARPATSARMRPSSSPARRPDGPTSRPHVAQPLVPGGSQWKPPKSKLSGYATFYDNGTTAMRLAGRHARADLRPRRLHPAHRERLRAAEAEPRRRHVPPGLLQDLRLPVVVGHRLGHGLDLLSRAARGCGRRPRAALDWAGFPRRSREAG